jgi:hypothetical protein
MLLPFVLVLKVVMVVDFAILIPKHVNVKMAITGKLA